MSGPNVLSLFTGAGGLDLGFEAAGFNTRLAIELDEDAAATIKANHDWSVLRKDITDISAIEIMRESGMRPDEVDMIIGGPPCQPFSKSGKWHNGTVKGLDDPRAATITSYMRLVHEFTPNAFLMENVPGFIHSNNPEGMAYIQRWVDKINHDKDTHYSLTSTIIDAADHGVPQHRERLIIVAHKQGLKFQFPLPTHGDLPCRQPYITAWDAIGDLDGNDGGDLQIRGKWADLLPTIPEGNNYLYHTRKGDGMPLFGYRTRYWGFLLKLAKDRPSWTIQADPGPSIGPFHWRNRLLSIAELKRLQTIPDEHELVGDRRSQRRQVGNAVPPLLAEELALYIGHQFFDIAFRAPSLMMRRRGPAPSEEAVAAVPKQYLHRVGDHPDHPGVGLGPKWAKVPA